MGDDLLYFQNTRESEQEKLRSVIAEHKDLLAKQTRLTDECEEMKKLIADELQSSENKQAEIYRLTDELRRATQQLDEATAEMEKVEARKASLERVQEVVAEIFGKIPSKLGVNLDEAANKAVSNIGEHMSGGSAGAAQGGEQAPEADYEEVNK
nr:heat shock 70 kDa protein, mitochondrial isoform X2 [Ipomoea trifida]